MALPYARPNLETAKLIARSAEQLRAMCELRRYWSVANPHYPTTLDQQQMVRSALALLIEEEGARFELLIVRGFAEHADAVRRAKAAQKVPIQAVAR